MFKGIEKACGCLRNEEPIALEALFRFIFIGADPVRHDAQVVPKDLVFQVNRLARIKDGSLWNIPLIIAKIVKEANLAFFELHLSFELWHKT